MNHLKELWKAYYPYFTDIWQYLIIIGLFVIMGIVLLIIS